MKLHKLLLAIVSIIFLTSCGRNQREIDYTDPDTFIQDLSEYFDIEDEPEVSVNSFSDRVTYYLGDVSIDLDSNRNLFEMYFTSDKNSAKEMVDFFGVSLPEDFDELEPGDITQTFGDYVFVNVSRRDEERTQQFREQSEKHGRYFDARNDYNVHVLFLGEDEADS